MERLLISSVHIERPSYRDVVRVKLARRCMRRIANLLDLLMGCETQPTELMFALLTCHVLTAVNFLDSPSAI